MRGIDELDHYEMLEIRRGATPGEIDRAYRMAQETFADDSLALYSVFEQRDASAIRARLDEAYRVLADPELRASYDGSLGNGLGHALAQDVVGPTASALALTGVADAIAVDPEVGGGVERRAEAEARRAEASAGKGMESTTAALRGANGARGVERARSVAAPRAVRAFEAGEAARVEEALDPESAARGADQATEDELAGDFDGPRLRRTRLFRGWEIDQIADVTKVTGAHLRNIEDENFADLPADVYVRGFVTAYAKTIGLDPQQVVPSYMARLHESRQKNQRSRFLGRR